MDESIRHWLRLAEESEAFAEYEESRGSSGSAWRNKARSYRMMAEAIDLDRRTAVHHCACCLKPMSLHRKGS